MQNMQKCTTFKCLRVCCLSARMNVSGHIDAIRRLSLRQVPRWSVVCSSSSTENDLAFPPRGGIFPLVPCNVSPILWKKWLFPFPFMVSPRLPNHDDVRRPMHPCVRRQSAMARLACAIAGDTMRGRES